jgi:hypothetical protein
LQIKLKEQSAYKNFTVPLPTIKIRYYLAIVCQRTESVNADSPSLKEEEEE